MTWIAIIGLVVAAIVVWQMRRGASGDAAVSASRGRAARALAKPGAKAGANLAAGAISKAQPSTAFGSVEIQARGVPCEAANAISGKRYLVNDAPPLPLPECDAKRCQCRFVKLADRRTEDRRLEQSGIHASLFEASDRRERSGRRGED